MAQKMNATLPLRSNAPVTPFAEETKKASKKVAKTRQTVDEAQIAELEAKQAAQAGEEQQEATEQAQAAPKAQTQTHIRQLERQALADQGLKRCSYHTKYLDRLPADAQQAIGGQTDVSIRRLDDFGKSSSAADGKQSFCKACDHVQMADSRARIARTLPASTAKIEATIARKVAQRDALTGEVEALTARLMVMRNAQAGSGESNA
jgi:hypothetical protein